MSRRRERGVVLLAAVGALAGLTVIATGLVHTSTLDQHLAHNARAGLQADALLRSGVAAAAVLLRETAVAEPVDSLHAPWARGLGRQPLGAGWVEVRIEDAARRLDLTAPALTGHLPRLLAALNLDAGLADAIADWIDADDDPRAHGAERDWYRSRVPSYAPANAPLRSVGELRLVRGVDASVLARLRPFVATAGERAVNPNTAPREVLVALADAAAAERVLAARRERPLGHDALRALLPGVPPERITARGTSYLVRVTAAVGDVRRAAEVTLWAPAGVDPEVRGWRPLPSPG